MIKHSFGEKWTLNISTACGLTFPFLSHYGQVEHDDVYLYFFCSSDECYVGMVILQYIPRHHEKA